MSSGNILLWINCPPETVLLIIESNIRTEIPESKYKHIRPSKMYSLILILWPVLFSIGLGFISILIFIQKWSELKYLNCSHYKFLTTSIWTRGFTQFIVGSFLELASRGIPWVCYTTRYPWLWWPAGWVQWRCLPQTKGKR